MWLLAVVAIVGATRTQTERDNNKTYLCLWSNLRRYFVTYLTERRLPFCSALRFPPVRGRGGGATCGSESVAGGSFWPIAQSRPVVSTREGAIRFSECLLFGARQKVYDLLMSRLGKQRQLRFGQLRRLGQLIRNLAHILFILLNKFHVMFMGSTCIYCCCCCGRRAR